MGMEMGMRIGMSMWMEMNTYVVAELGRVELVWKQVWYAQLTLCLDIERTYAMTYELFR